MSTQSKTSDTVHADEKISAYGTCSERCELSRLQAAALYAMLTWTAIALGIWGGLKVLARPAHSITSVVRRTGPLSCRRVREIVAGALLPADYIPIDPVEIDGVASPSFLSKLGLCLGRTRCRAAALQTCLITKGIWSGATSPPSIPTTHGNSRN